MALTGVFMSRPVILIANDDGYFADGIRHLLEALSPLGRVISVAPDTDCSGVSHKISIHSALRIRQVGEDAYAINGTPADCIHLGVFGILDGVKPDLVVSGINHGPNLGEDTAYSGTVAAAYEANVQGMPAFAISTGKSKQDDGFHFETAATVAYRLARAHFQEENDFLKRALWNINVPPHADPDSVRVVKLDKRSFQSSVVKREDPRGVPYYWMGPYYPKFDNLEHTDFAAYREGFISMTPLKVEMTHHDVLNDFSHQDFAGLSDT